MIKKTQQFINEVSEETGIHPKVVEAIVRSQFSFVKKTMSDPTTEQSPHENLIGNEDMQSWVFNHLPLNPQQKLGLLKVLNKEISLEDHLLDIASHPIELDKEQNCEKTTDSPVELDVQGLCLNAPETLD